MNQYTKRFLSRNKTFRNAKRSLTQRFFANAWPATAGLGS